MSRSTGPHTADPCPRCLTEEVRTGTPASADGREVVRYLCGTCAHTWSRPVEYDLEVHAVVRVDLPHATLYGTVRQVDHDRIQVAIRDSDRHLWADRWRVTSY